MPFITLTGGLTLKVPTRGTEDWDTEFLDNFATPLSNHTHTGSGDGNQLGSGSLVDNAVSDLKMRLRNNQYFRARDVLGTGDINVLKVKTDDTLEFPVIAEFLSNITMQTTLTVKDKILSDELANDTVFTMTNNQSSAADVTGFIFDTTNDKGWKVEYSIERLGTADLQETGDIEVSFDGTNFQQARSFSRDESGITFSFTAGGQLQYTSTDNAGSTSEKLHLIIKRLGE